MKIDTKGKSLKNIFASSLTAAVLGLGLSMPMSTAFADSYSMAPPISTTTSTTGPADNASEDTVFQWNEVPQDQQVPIVRAVFDQGGYQLFDNVGETIVVPFTNNNLYVMKFAVSPDGKTFFVNDGSAPTLYLPRNGYLENATVPGAKWYPFTKKFHPSTPVFVGIAPSWHLFIGMGWYPHMACWGGYWGATPFFAGGVFVPCDGFAFDIGGSIFLGWSAYHTYWWHNPPPYHVAYWHRDVYRWASRPVGPSHAFAGSARYGSYRGGSGFHGGFNASGRMFRGAGAHFSGGHFSHGGHGFGGHGGGFGGHGGGFGGHDRGR